MTRQFLVVSAVCVLSLIMTACGSTALPSYDSDSTSVAVARTATRDALVAQGQIIPSDTPTMTPSPTVDFEATNAVVQATDDAIATVTAEFEATASAEAEAMAVMTADAQATIDAQPTQVGADDPLFDEIANADPANGEMLFTANALSPCITCHLVDTEDALVGPGQLNVFARTVERLEDGTIEADGPYSYLHNSIINPGDYLTVNESGVPYPNAMPANYADFLTEQEIYDLVAYLVTLGD